MIIIYNFCLSSYCRKIFNFRLRCFRISGCNQVSGNIVTIYQEVFLFRRQFEGCGHNTAGLRIIAQQHFDEKQFFFVLYKDSGLIVIRWTTEEAEGIRPCDLHRLFRTLTLLCGSCLYVDTLREEQRAVSEYENPSISTLGSFFAAFL